MAPIVLPCHRPGVRTVTVPEAVRADLLGHLKAYVGKEPTALLSTLENFRQRRSRAELLPAHEVDQDGCGPRAGGLHFHDLRHAGNIWAPKAGMSTKDVMSRMGHDDVRAALIYQRATEDADVRIADSLSKLVDEHRGKGPKPKRKRRRTKRKPKAEGT